MNRSFIDLAGQKFGRLTAINYGIRVKGRLGWRCKCDCGKECQTLGQALRDGLTKSCGCLNREVRSEVDHGHSLHRRASPTYRTWDGIIQRCRNQNNGAFEHYGGRGIAVCERWLTFSSFLADMGERPAGLEIDRIDNDKGYEPGNCQWAARIDQLRNRRNTIWITIGARKATLTEWARYFGVPEGIAWARKKDGWDLVKAVSAPVAYKKPRPAVQQELGL